MRSWLGGVSRREGGRRVHVFFFTLRSALHTLEPGVYDDYHPEQDPALDARTIESWRIQTWVDDVSAAEQDIREEEEEIFSQSRVDAVRSARRACEALERLVTSFTAHMEGSSVHSETEAVDESKALCPASSPRVGEACGLQAEDGH